jgi:Glutathione S-transferase, N-terminal domain
MSPDTLKLYHSTASPNSRRVRIFLAEKGLKVALVPVDLGKGEQHSALNVNLPNYATAIVSAEEIVTSISAF